MTIIFVVIKKYLRREWLGIMYLSAALKKQAFAVRVCPDDTDTVVKAARVASGDGAPVILAYSTPTFLAARYIEFNRAARKAIGTRTWSLFGGPHPTYYPEMIDEEGVDAICLGEGEEAMLDFACRLRDGQDPGDCLNWHVKQPDGTVRRNPLRPLRPNLDELPFPDRTLFRVSRAAPRWFMIGRGCPYGCAYCFNRAYNKLYNVKKPVMRRRSVANVIAELADLRDRHGGRSFQSVDDVFGHPPLDWLREFADEYPARIGLPLGGNVRPNLVSEEAVALLKNAGMVGVGMGVETGNEKLRARVLNRHMTNKTIREAAARIRDAGLMLTTYNIIGIPGGGADTDMETVNLNQEIRPTHAICFILGAYKGTAIFDTAHSMGLIAEDYIEEMSDSSRHLYGWHPKLTYKDEAEALRIENLHKLFSILVAFPRLSRFLPLLLRKRWTPLYQYVSVWFARAVIARQRLRIARSIRGCRRKVHG